MSTERVSSRRAAADNMPAQANPEVATNANNPENHTHEYLAASSSENIFLLWPNVIGYARIILAVASLYYMPLHPRTCSLLYSVSSLLDALDGYVARVFDQSTRFGAVLDMITDRCATSCLLVFLSLAFPRWTIVFQGLLALDFSSHYMHMYATFVVGGSGSSHKNIDKNQSWLLYLYYTNKSVLFLLSAFNEIFFIGLYLLSFSSSLPSAASVVAGGPADALLPQQNPFSAAALEIARADKIDSFWPGLVVRASFPFMAVKQIINVVQLVNASKRLAEADLEARRAKGLPRGRSKRG